MIDLTLVRNHMEHRERLGVVREINRVETLRRRVLLAKYFAACVSGLLAGWLIAELIDLL